jgi:F-type H+-transporting ATPase subunit b
LRALVIVTALSLLGFPALALAGGDGLNLIPNLTLLVANLVVFGLLIYPTQRWLLAPLVRVLAEREQRTAGALERAQSTHAEAVQMREDLERELATARADAQAHRAVILGEAEAEERRILDEARTDASRALEAVRSSVEGELADARRTLQSDARDLSREAAVRILGRAL